MKSCKCVLGAWVILGLLAGSVSANLLQNASFEDQNLDSWLRKDRALDNLWNFPGGGEQVDGLYAARFVEGSFSGVRPNGAIVQTVTFGTPFTGDLTFSGWVKRYVLDQSFAVQPTWGWAAAAIYVDGEHGVTPATAVPLNTPADDTWHPFSVTLPVTNVSSVDVALGWGLIGARSVSFDVVLADGWSLVPEPATLALMGFSAMFMVRRRR